MKKTVKEELKPGEFITYEEAAKLLRVSRSTIIRLIKKKVLPAYKLSDRIVRLKVSDITRLVERSQVGEDVGSSNRTVAGLKQDRKER